MRQADAKQRDQATAARSAAPAPPPTDEPRLRLRGRIRLIGRLHPFGFLRVPLVRRHLLSKRNGIGMSMTTVAPRDSDGAPLNAVARRRGTAAAGDVVEVPEVRGGADREIGASAGYGHRAAGPWR